MEVYMNMHIKLDLKRKKKPCKDVIIPVYVSVEPVSALSNRKSVLVFTPSSFLPLTKQNVMKIPQCIAV